MGERPGCLDAVLWFAHRQALRQCCCFKQLPRSPAALQMALLSGAGGIGVSVMPASSSVGKARSGGGTLWRGSCSWLIHQPV